MSHLQKNKFILALSISIIFHVVLVGGIWAWSIYNTSGSLGNGQIMEVAIVEGGGEGTSVKKILRRISNAILNMDHNTYDNRERDTQIQDKPTGDGYGAGSGIGDGKGEADPRLITIWKKINSSKYYPEIARREGLEGAPKVAFSIGLNGKIGEVKIVKSCGHDILDSAALETIKRSSPLPFYPKPITIAVRYSLKDR